MLFRRKYFTIVLPVFLALFFFVAFVKFFMVSTHWMVSGDDMGRCSELVDALLERHVFEKKFLSQPERAAVGCRPGSSLALGGPVDSIIIYYVTDPIEQREIVNKLLMLMKNLGSKKVVVNFYEEENVVTWTSPDGKTSGGRRGLENKIARFELEN